MPTGRARPKNVDEYIAWFSPEVRAILEKIRLMIRSASPDAQGTIRCNIPMFKRSGTLVYFAAFKKHIVLYPRVRGDAKRAKAASADAGPKGNLLVPFDPPIPYPLIEQIVKCTAKQNSSKATDRRKAPFTR
jgi:uncharacterized protein YdhG (YjbR/CyaY superfamily)